METIKSSGKREREPENENDKKGRQYREAIILTAQLLHLLLLHHVGLVHTAAR
jgi:hypothetical protein